MVERPQENLRESQR